jgi:ribosomal protein S18 acetylase RimI-like enzyme
MLLSARTRFRRVLDAGDPARLRKLVQATGVFSTQEARVAGELATTTLDGTETYRWLLAERDGELLGYTCFDRIPLTKASFDLYWIAVLPQSRGSGLATELLTRTTKLIKAGRGAQVFAETSSRPPYNPACAFYRKSGFEEVARFADFYEPGDDKLVFRLKL